MKTVSVQSYLKKKYQTKYKKNTHFNTTKIKAEYFL